MTDRPGSADQGTRDQSGRRWHFATAADLEHLTPEEINAARHAGLLDTLLGRDRAND